MLKAFSAQAKKLAAKQSRPFTYQPQLYCAAHDNSFGCEEAWGMRRLLLVGVVAALSCSCGSSDNPAAPSAPAIAQVAGVWRGTSTTTTVAGGECFASLFQGTVGGSDQVSLATTQSGSSVSATLTVTSTGGNYTYSGTVGQSALSLTGTSCSACNILAAHCPTGTAIRDLKIQTLGITGTVNGNTLTGTEAESYNILVAGTSSPVGTFTVNNAFTLTRQ